MVNLKSWKPWKALFFALVWVAGNATGQVPEKVGELSLEEVGAIVGEFEAKLEGLEAGQARLRDQVFTLQNQLLFNAQTQGLEFQRVRYLLGEVPPAPSGSGTVTPEPEPDPGPVVDSGELSRGNFLFEWRGDPTQSTMTLLSPSIPDDEKRTLLEWYASRGYNRIHVYTINDENYSGAKGNGSGQWAGVRYQPVFCKFTGIELDSAVEMPAVWHSWTAEQERGNYLYWLVQARKLGLKITVWLWCNQATESFNNLQRWNDARVLSYNTEVVRQLCNYLWDGSERLVDEICLKLEADDEWGERGDSTNPWKRTSLDVLNRRAEAHYSMIQNEGGGQTVWYHNEADNSAFTGFVWDQLNWENFDGIRIQAPMWELEEAQIEARALELVAAVPEGKLFTFSEYSQDGEVNARIGDKLWSMRERFGENFRGLDNGGGLGE